MSVLGNWDKLLLFIDTAVELGDISSGSAHLQRLVII